jgi:hypothetical protein
MSLWESLLVSAVPVVCETIILQEMYIALYKVCASVRQRLIYGLIFIAIQYPITYMTDNIAFFAPFGIIRSILIFLLYALMLRTVFKGRFLSRCLQPRRSLPLYPYSLKFYYGLPWNGWGLMLRASAIRSGRFCCSRGFCTRRSFQSSCS